jgi:hypothetical protein
MKGTQKKNRKREKKSVRSKRLEEENENDQ